MIPRILHFIWGGSELPAWAARNIAEFRRLNPDFEIRLHDESSLLPELRPAFDAAQVWSSKSDPLRYSILRQFGGWYFDVDFWPLRPISQAYDCWDLTSDRVFLSRQQGHKSGARMPYAATPLACHQDAPGLQRIIDAMATVAPETRTAFGPELIKQVVTDHPALFDVADPGWFFPVSIREAPIAYPHFLANQPNRLALRTAGTGGHLPFAAHMWAEAVDMAATFAQPVSSTPLAIVQSAGRVDHPLDAIAKGLAAIGYQVERAANATDIAVGIIRPDLLVTWNGRRDTTWDEAAKRFCCPILYLEHGFYQRQHYTQVDHAGFLHKASWRSTLRDPAPSGADDRLAPFVPSLVPMAARSAGYILVLGQVPGDTQLLESEFAGPAPFLRHLAGVMPSGVPAYFRPHPQQGSQARNRLYRNLPELPTQADERAAYSRTKGGTGLASALAGARFCVAINTNALNEALALGIPCLAFGPMLGIEAGVVRRATTATIRADLAAMLNGWCPDSDAVATYLRHLAARQWNTTELRDPATLEPLLVAAGAHVPAAVEAVA